MKKIVLTISLLVFGLFLPKVFAQTTSSSSATTVHLAFPIAELGNCSSTADCKTYCDDTLHIDACIAYAREKGFYQQNDLDTKQQQILVDAKTTLGCSSVDSCRTFCSQSANTTACSEFAKSHNLKGGNQQIDNTIFQKAKSTLGCDGASSCQTFCQQESNKDKCARFAKENGLKGGNQQVGPGGCSSQESCQTFCSNPSNASICQQFAQSHISSTSGVRMPLQENIGSPSGKRPIGIHSLPPDKTLSPISGKDFVPGQERLLQRPTSPTGNNSIISSAPRSSDQNIPTIENLQNTSVGLTPIPQESVKGTSTQRNIFSWLLDNWFHLK